VEYGGDFPIDKILAITIQHGNDADADLLNLVRRADRSRYEDPHGMGLMTDSQLALFEHIHGQHDRLTHRLRR
jgi:hypothetical protein